MPLNEASAADMRNALDNLSACVYIKDVAGRYTFVNRRVCQFLGLPLEDILGKDDGEFFDLSVHHQFKFADQQVLRTGKTVEQRDVAVRKRDGALSIHWSVKSPVYGPDGEIIGLCGMSTELGGGHGGNHAGQSLRVNIWVMSDFRLVQDSLAQLFRSQPERYLLQGCSDTLEGEAPPWGKHKPDVVLLDLDMDPERTLSWLRHWRAEADIKALLMTRRENPAVHDQAMLAGARGLIDRHTSQELLLVALERVCKGEIWLDHASTARLLGELSTREGHTMQDPVARQVASLTQREQAILVTLLHHSGEPAKMVAAHLHISESTLRNHLTSIYEKVGVSNRNGLLAYALHSGLAARLVPEVDPGRG